MLAFLPFEKAFYDKYNVPCRYRYTMADALPLQPDKPLPVTHWGWIRPRRVWQYYGQLSRGSLDAQGDFLKTAHRCCRHCRIYRLWCRW